MAGLPSLFQEIDKLKGELDALRPFDREVEQRVLQKFRLWWTYHSNAIEGNKLTQGETEMFLMEGLTAKGKPLKDHLDLKGHSDAINYLLQLVRNKEPITEVVIREMHRVLLVEPYNVPALTPDGQPTSKTVSIGEYKTQPNHVRTPTGEMHYYSTPLETPANMRELVTWEREASEKRAIHVVEIAAYFHHRFTAIHPFDDGNGRMARLLMNLLLMREGYPPVVIRNGERDAYLYALRQADAGNANELIQLVAEHVRDSLDLFTKGVKGEDIHEPTDLEKEIALLKMELSAVEEAEPFSIKALDEVMETSIVPLFLEIKRMLLPISEWFVNAEVTTKSTYRSTYHSETLEASTDLSEATSPPVKWPMFNREYGKGDIESLTVGFVFKNFRRSGLETFDVSASFHVHFERLKYSVQRFRPNQPVWQHLYQEKLTKDEIGEMARAVVREIVDEVKSKNERLTKNGGKR
ncbi:Fic family protein [Roseimicrobium sp. ORNL1]|uniref:Fic family protein n=1 Tax=Roseimicrobium sp. ORNL1 TaxID=2711231 RepID=UPI0013E1B467|nr:Fic family protein [Roseimicrobium sp. ORNL1]QIF03315.1 Fic family protein [Roseimicrobium sp. ORNL1]